MKTLSPHSQHTGKNMNSVTFIELVFCVILVASSANCLQIYNITCPDTGEFYLANPSDCRSYYYCWSGDSFLQFCPRGYYFHLAERRCTTPDIADCGGFVDLSTSLPTSGTTAPSRPGKPPKPNICIKVCGSPDAQNPIGTFLKSLCQCQRSRQNQPPPQPEVNILDSIGKAINAILNKPQ